MLFRSWAQKRDRILNKALCLTKQGLGHSALRYFVCAVLSIILFIASPDRAEGYRIISLAPNTTEILFALGLGDSIVGVDEYSDYPAKAMAIESVGTFLRPNIERIILLRPDYILVNSDMDKDAAGYLEGLGVTIIKVAPENVEELCDKIEKIGLIDRKSTRLNSSHTDISRMPSSA